VSIAIGGHVATAAATSGTATTAASGSTFVVCVGFYSGTLTGIADNKGNGSYTQIQSTVAGGDAAFKAALFYFQNGAGGSGHTWTASFSAGPALAAVLALEITGGLTSGILDQAPVGLKDTHSDATPYVSSVTGATTQAAELVVAFTHTYTNSAGPESHTWNNSYTGVDSLTDPNFWTAASSYKLLGATGTQQSSVTANGATASDAVTFIATFKEGVAASTSDPVESAARRQVRQNAIYRMSPRAEREAQQYLRAQKRTYGFAVAA
jgi:hypothetical protein